MYISLDEAIAMHARMGLARFGSRGAKKRAISMAHRFRRKGDDAGAAVWERVAAEIDLLIQRERDDLSADCFSFPRHSQP